MEEEKIKIRVCAKKSQQNFRYESLTKGEIGVSKQEKSSKSGEWRQGRDAGGGAAIERRGRKQVLLLDEERT